MPLPERVRQESWDLIFVDGPVSELFGGRGRQSSLVAASQLAGPETAVCVHDTDRPLERLFCRELFDHSRSFRQVERMRIYPPCPVTSAGR